MVRILLRREVGKASLSRLLGGDRSRLHGHLRAELPGSRTRVCKATVCEQTCCVGRIPRKPRDCRKQWATMMVETQTKAWKFETLKNMTETPDFMLSMIRNHTWGTMIGGLT